MKSPRTVTELDQRISTPTPEVLAAVEQLPGTFAVLGAGGKMGLHLCLMLHKACQQLGRRGAVTAISRFGSPRSREAFERAGIPVLAADLSDPARLETLPFFDQIFFLAGVKFGTSQQPELLERMNVEMPQGVARHFRDARIVALSTGCVYAFSTPASGGSREESETDPPGDYARSCLGREAAFRKAAEQYGTRSALIRLNYSIDLRYGVLVDLARKILAGEPISVEMGYVNLIWQGDALAHTIQSMPRASAPPFVVNVTGAEILSVRELALRLGELLGKCVEILGEEQPTAWLSNPAKAVRLFGPPRVTVEQMLQWTADWMANGGETWNKPTHFETRAGAY